jgi:hypothetical protein
MALATEIWKPGSFTKNFSWGTGRGLLRLYEHIRIGFGNKLEPVARAEYESRTASQPRPDKIPLNFFLFNEIVDGVDTILVDELVFQALTAPHSDRFDKLALFSFNFSRAGVWKGSLAGQRYPALWAQNYVVSRVANEYRWETGKISANDIEAFLRSSPLYVAETFTKVSTNLNFLYSIGGLSEYNTKRIERWWVDALFLAIDRLVADRHLDGITTASSELPGLLLRSKFRELTGPVTPEKTFAMAHLLSLYSISGGVDRFSPERVKDRTSVLLPDYTWQEPNDDRPQGALHPTNPRILKSIPRSCSKLAESAGFQIVFADDLEVLDPDDFVDKRATEAVDSLRRDSIRPIMSAEALHKLTRGE